MRTDIIKRREEITQWIEQERSKAEICRELECRPDTLERCLRLLGLSYAGNPGGKGRKQSPHRRKAQEYLHNGTIIIAHKLKLKLFEEGLKQKCCERCDLSMWLGTPIPLELHHVNGDRFDNRLENLQVLCPNCHALTSNHAGRGMGRKGRISGEVVKW